MSKMGTKRLVHVLRDFEMLPPSLYVCAFENDYSKLLMCNSVYGRPAGELQLLPNRILSGRPGQPFYW